MGDAYITRRGGGGSKPSPTDAVLRATAPSGSTVTITKSGVTRTPNFYLDGTDTDTFFLYIKVADFGTYTVTATLSGQTTSGSVAVSAPQEYEIALSYLVPSAYQAVEYLQSTGTQGFKTNLYGEGITFELDITPITNTDDAYYVGVWGLQTNSQFRVGASDGKFYMASGNNFPKSPTAIQLNDRYRITAGISNNQRTFRFENLTKGTEETVTTTYISTVAIAIALFCENNGGTLQKWQRAKIYSFKGYSYGTPVCHLVPCYRKSDNVAGMWDRVGETFYTNEGTGTFVVGEPI